MPRMDWDKKFASFHHKIHNVMIRPPTASLSKSGHVGRKLNLELLYPEAVGSSSV